MTNHKDAKPPRQSLQAGSIKNSNQAYTIAGAGNELTKEVDQHTLALAKGTLQLEKPTPQAQNKPEAQETISIWLYRLNQEPSECKLEDLPQLVSVDENFVWVDLCTYSEETIKKLAQLLKLHPVEVKATLSSWHRPRFDKFSNHFYVATTVAQPDTVNYQVQAGQLNLFVGQNFLVSAHQMPLPFIDPITVRTRQSPELVELDSAFMLYIILEELLEYYENLNEHIEDQNEEMEQRALKDTSDTFLADLVKLKRYIFTLTRLAEQHRQILVAFLAPDSPFNSNEEVKPYFHDLNSHFDRLMDLLIPARESVNGAFDIYVSHVSHRTNQVMKILTMVSVVLLPTTVVLGFFGTNFQDLPIYTSIDFMVMVGIILFTTAVILLFFHLRKWF